jgi:cobalamin-dependent methionine synthase I
VRQFGAAVVVMGFDEEGQATNVERRIDIAKRAYRILSEECGFDPRDIIFDPNILTVATGMPEHNDYGLNFIEAVRQIKELFPAVKTTGGVSNVSFSFRGNNVVREAIHAAFLYHAIDAGLDTGIVNAGQLAVYDEVEDELMERVEDVLWNRRDDATDRLVEYAERYKGQSTQRKESLEWREGTVEERLRHALVHGIDRFIEDDVEVHSVSAGLDYPGVGPEHAMFRAVGRCEYTGVTDDEALAAFRELSETEGIIPALESSHGIARAIELAEAGDHDTILVNLSGRGDKDMETAAAKFDL